MLITESKNFNKGLCYWAFYVNIPRVREILGSNTVEDLRFFFFLHRSWHAVYPIYEKISIFNELLSFPYFDKDTFHSLHVVVTCSKVSSG